MDAPAHARRQERPAPPQSFGTAREEAVTDRAIADLSKMLESLSPKLRPGIWVYAVLPENAPVPGCAAAFVDEAEGRTVVLRQEDAEALGLTPLFRGKWITLRVHSCLTAAGMMARVAAALAEENIPANILAGFSHDHLLVPEDLPDQALACLRRLQEDAAMHVTSMRCDRTAFV
jgi:hypothetical protein